MTHAHGRTVPVRRPPGDRRGGGGRPHRQDPPAQPGRDSAAHPGPGGALPAAAVGQPQPGPDPAHRPAPGEPREPPMFCMPSAKVSGGGKILALRQPPMERLAELVIEATNEMGDELPPTSGAGGHGPADQPDAVGRGGPDCGLPPPDGGGPDPGPPLAAGDVLSVSRGPGGEVGSWGPHPRRPGGVAGAGGGGGPGRPVPPGSLLGPVPPAGPGVGL